MDWERRGLKFSRDLRWLKPFVEAVDSIVPNIKNLNAIKKLGVKGNTKCRIAGVTIHSIYDDPCHRDTWEIYIYTEYNEIQNLNKPPLKFKKRRYSKLDILATLAHELTHLHEWEHTPKRQILESKILIRFMELIEDQGYISEEKEMKEWKRDE